MPRSVLRIGTRSSALALAQAETVRQAIQQVITRRNFELVPIVTEGDSIVDDYPALGARGEHVAEIQDALALAKIDLAVHKATDAPLHAPDQVALAAVPPRIDPRDAVLTRRGSPLSGLQPGARVGVSSRARAAQILAMQRGLVPVSIGGSLDLQLRRLTAGDYDALVVGVGGLRRLGKEHRISEILPIDVMLPSPGAGCLVVECRATDRDMRAALAQIEDPASRRAFDAERAFLAAVGGDAALPIAALAKLDGPTVKLRALVASPDGATIMRDVEAGEDPAAVGETLAQRMITEGAATLLNAVPA